MNEKNAPTFEDLESATIDFPQAIGKLAVTTYNETNSLEQFPRFESAL